MPRKKTREFPKENKKAIKKEEKIKLDAESLEELTEQPEEEIEGGKAEGITTEETVKKEEEIK